MTNNNNNQRTDAEWKALGMCPPSQATVAHSDVLVSELSPIKVRIFWSEEGRRSYSESVTVCRQDPFESNENFSVAEMGEGWTTCYFTGESHDFILNEVYKMQGNNPEGEKLFDCQCTLSVGDVIEITEGTDCFLTAYIVARFGFVKIQVNADDANFITWKNSSCSERIMMGRKLSKGNKAN